MSSIQSWFSLALWLAGIGHFCVLGASFQVPGRLRWKEDLAKLTPFNRKLMWVYAGTTLATIIAFGALTLFLHDDILRRDRAALALAAFIALFWTGRIVVDFTYFEHSDWPVGRQFVVGHFLLTSLFTALASTYWATLIWSFFERRLMNPVNPAITASALGPVRCRRELRRRRDRAKTSADGAGICRSRSFRMSKNPYEKRRPLRQAQGLESIGGLGTLSPVETTETGNRKIMNICSGPNPADRTE